MGQCSTLPAEGRTASNASKRSDSGNNDSMMGGNHHHKMSSPSSSSKYRSHPRSATHKVSSSTSSAKKNSFLQVQTQNLNNGGGGVGQNPPGSKAGEHMNSSISNNNGPQSREPKWTDPRHADYMMDDDRMGREQFPAPPEVAVRTRCYKLNLDADINPQSGTFLGPFTESPPPLTYSDSEDSAAMNSPVEVAVKTAKIFRGITVSKDGTILSQNARATRSSRGSKNKRGEKSRQATKIDKAKDLVEESIRTGKAPDSDKPANMVSLIAVGEYDEMKQLVRDGSKKLREATDKTDDVLFSINRPRGGVVYDHATAGQAMWSPRKRLSPHHSTLTSPHQQHNGMEHYDHSKSPRSQQLQQQHSSSGRSTPMSARMKGQHRPPPSSTRSSTERHHRMMNGGNNGSTRQFHNGTPNNNGNNADNNSEGDWSNALSFSRGFHSIWNCGGGEASGNISPTQVVSTTRDGKPIPMNMASSAPYSSSAAAATGAGNGMPGSSHNSKKTSVAVFDVNGKPVFEGRDTKESTRAN